MNTMSRLIQLGSFVLVAATATACGENPSATNLVPEGPPKVRQVFMAERVTDNGGVTRVLQSIAFGDHPDFYKVNEIDDREVINATVASTQRIRVVMDELLLGNYLEQIQCRDGTYQSVPEGATPDDIAACAVANDVLAQTCTGPYAVCLGPDGPIGVMDEEDADSEQDGAADDTRFIEGAVRIACTPTVGGGEIDVPLSLSNTFWQPSGNQQVPSAGGFSAVGPAIILAPSLGLPTSSTCTIAFDDSVVDKDHVQVCAPEGGDPDVDCTPGDTARIVFGSEPLRVLGTNPPDGATGVALGSPDARILVQFNTTVESPLDDAAFVLLENGAPRAFTAVRNTANQANVDITVTGGYLAGADYELQISTNLADQFGVGLPASQATSVTWSTTP